jgi:hypothetical protein
MTNTFDEYVEKAVRLSLAKPALPALQQLIGLLVDQWLASGRPLKQLEKQTGWNGARELRRANEGKAA